MTWRNYYPAHSRNVLKRRDKSFPREWFHLPEGAEPPTVEELLRDSDDEEENDPIRAASPPICGKGRSKSREQIRLKQKYAAKNRPFEHTMNAKQVPAASLKDDNSRDEETHEGGVRRMSRKDMPKKERRSPKTEKKGITLANPSNNTSIAFASETRDPLDSCISERTCVQTSAMSLFNKITK